MTEIPGMIRPELQALPQISDKMTFIYLERCVLNRQDGAITVTDENGTVHIPAAAISAFAGPGNQGDASCNGVNRRCRGQRPLGWRGRCSLLCRRTSYDT